MSLMAVLFAGIYGYAILQALFGFSAWSFFGYQAVYFAHPDSRWWSASLPVLPYSYLTVLAMFWVAAFRNSGSRRAALAPAPLRWMLLVLAIHLALSPIAVAPEDHAKAVNEFTKLCVVMLLASIILNSYRRIVCSLWAFSGGAAYIGWVAYTTGRNVNNRVEGIGPVDSPDSNGFAAAIAPALALVLVAMISGTTRQKVAAALVGALVANGLILINSRGAFVAVLVGCSYVMVRLYFARVRQRRQRATLVAVMLVGLAGGLHLADDQFWSRMGTLREVDDGSASGSHRVEMWVATFELVADYPLGAGVKGFHELSPRYVPADLFAAGQTRKSVHSTWFQSLAETGWIGLAAFLAMLASTFRATSKARRTAKRQGNLQVQNLIVAVEGGLLTYLVAASFMDRYRAEILYWFVLYGSAVYSVTLRLAQQGGSSPALGGPSTDSRAEPSPPPAPTVGQHPRSVS